ncbi:MAG TPA: ABC transporter permease subunit [Micromonosporaceae bacterium]|jgi:ABC-type transport system involved in multi-copper enzyme maturation permease subunit
MTWFTWRQFRTQSWIALAGLAVVAVVLLINGHALTELYASTGAATCHADCGTALNAFLDAAGKTVSNRIYNFARAMMYVVPAIIGIFWGAPLIARELETGTYRLVWNQSVTRTRWLATKLAGIGLASVATMGILSFAVTAWAHHIDHASNNRILPDVYITRGIVPVAYAAFAFAVGVTAGMLIRRTVPAMATTLVVYVAAVVSIPLVRANLVPMTTVNRPLSMNGLDMMIIIGADGRGGSMQVSGSGGPPGAWVLSNRTITTAGHVFTGPANPQYCGPTHGPQECQNWLGTLGLRQVIRYQPVSHFWPMQWAETGIFVAVALLLVGFCFWWTRRRLV